VRISVREIRDYQRCSLYYKLKHVDEIPIQRSIDDVFKEYMKLALYAYYFSLMEKKKKTFEGLMKRWEELWFSQEMIAALPEEELRQKSNDAVLIMSDFYKKYGSEPATPVAVNFQYEAIFEGKENLHITGEIDLIKILNDRTRNSETCICSFSLSKGYPDIFIIKNDITLGAASYAFRSNFKAKEDKIITMNICCSDDTPTLRTGSDYIRTEKAVRNICNGIKNGVFYPSPNKINCSNCAYKMFCLNEKSINMGVNECQT
jgi:hypothetical protein